MAVRALGHWLQEQNGLKLLWVAFEGTPGFGLLLKQAQLGHTRDPNTFVKNNTFETVAACIYGSLAVQLIFVFMEFLETNCNFCMKPQLDIYVISNMIPNIAVPYNVVWLLFYFCTRHSL